MGVHEYLKNGTLDVYEWRCAAQSIWNQMVDAVQYIHAQHCCHFDISLENFLISGFQITHSRDCNNGEIKTKIAFLPNLQIKLCDFGLSVYFGSNHNFLSSKYCGKEQYKSPEIVNKKKHFHAKSNDIWSLGICLFKMMIGCAPWNVASESDASFKSIMDGQLVKVLTMWQKTKYANQALLSLFELFFKNENERSTLKKIRHCPFFGCI